MFLTKSLKDVINQLDDINRWLLSLNKDQIKVNLVDICHLYLFIQENTSEVKKHKHINLDILDNIIKILKANVPDLVKNLDREVKLAIIKPESNEEVYNLKRALGETFDAPDLFNLTAISNILVIIDQIDILLPRLATFFKKYDQYIEDYSEDDEWISPALDLFESIATLINDSSLEDELKLGYSFKLANLTNQFTSDILKDIMHRNYSEEVYSKVADDLIKFKKDRKSNKNNDSTSINIFIRYLLGVSRRDKERYLYPIDNHFGIHRYI
jgi:hypothetical protein